MLLCLYNSFSTMYLYIYISILVSGLVPDLSLHFLSVKILLSSDQIVCPQIWLTLVQGAPPVTFAHLLSHAGNQPFCCVSNPRVKQRTESVRWRWSHKEGKQDMIFFGNPRQPVSCAGEETDHFLLS